MTTIIFAAFQLGFVYSLLPGPVTIASSQRTITCGWCHGLWFVLGVTLSDLICIALLHWGLADVMTNSPLLSLAFWVLGGGWLLKLGFDALRVPINEQWVRTTLGNTFNRKHTLVDGMFINLLSPLTLIGWIALGANFLAMGNTSDGLSENTGLLALLAILAGIIAWELLIIGMTSLLHRQMNPRVLKYLSLVGGVCLIGYGLSAWVSAAQMIT